MHTRRSCLSASLVAIACLAAPRAFAQTSITESGKVSSFQSSGDLLMTGHCFGSVNPMPTAGVVSIFNGAAVTNNGNLFFSGPVAWNSTSFPGDIVVKNGATTIASISSGSLYLKGKCSNTSGCRNTIWEPTRWTNDINVQITNNCYNYAVDKITAVTAAPGRAGGIDIGDHYDISVLHNALIADGLTFVGDAFPGNTYDCGTGHLIFMALSPMGPDYHFYRLDQATGLWSHKRGQSAPQQGDATAQPPRYGGRPITNPLDAARGIYTTAGGFWCTCGGNNAIR